MNQHLQNILNTIQQDENLTAEQKDAISKSLKEADKEFEITSFKLDRTEKVKRTTAILLEETIEELEHKRIAVEAQNRELEIESSLERVRTVAMSMNKPDEMLDVCKTIALQLQSLGVKEIRNVQTAIFYPARGTYMNYEFYTKHDKTFVTETIYTNHEVARAFAEKMFKGKGEVSVTSIRGKEVKDWLAYQKTTNVFIDSFLENVTSLDYYWHSLGPVALGISTYHPLSGEELQLFQRFLKVFDLSYRRYLDIEKAIAQAREAKIEAALERVRSRSLAMHHSSELSAVVDTLLREFTNLEFTLTFCIINLIDEQDRSNTVWAANPETGKDPESYYMKFEDYPFHHAMWDAWKEQKKNFIYTMEGEEKKIYDEYLYTKTEFRRFPKHVQEANKALKRYVAGFTFFKYSGLQTVSENHISVDELALLERFGRVFEQSYTRFLDLQKAEAQARQAKIEAAMEKVRSRAMAMQKPNELIEVAELLRKEMGLLGVEELETSSIYIHHEETQKTECWYAIRDVAHPEKKLVSDHMNMELNETWVGRQMLDFYRSGKKQISIAMKGDNRKEWIKYCADRSKVLVGYYGDTVPDRTYHLYKFSNGYIGAASPGDISVESWDLLQRATSVFSLAYTRFNDLQQAEAQAREAKIEAALERVRSRTLAMQKSDELAETAAEVFRQLISLGIEPNRLYIGIVKEETGDMEMWATDEDGAHVGKKFMFNKNENASVKKLFDGWKAKEKSVIVDMQGKELEDYFHYLNDVMHIPFKGGLIQKRRVQSVAYFSKGFIGMASPDGQGDETIQLLERFAAVFNLTFTRFNDLKIAEAHAQQAEQDLIAIKEAKQKAEEALTELQATQKQLIQSEKMASLGELTAGIAHEIQNPLNFVNNFSEVSNELMDEMNAEIEKGDMEEAKAIANDIKQNLEKILHHGKRADGIVKGMLQHSRSSSATKEPTDINKLADEYLRLAYHGLRAKDKSFNATLKTDYDESIGNIYIIPQDIGRVILNLITNAFYVVNEKKNLGVEGYEPTVTISTKKSGSRVFVSVKDNGNGIPQKALDKIFQPFFTTKPTGQGTGLGLSLSYDIIKAHGGELKVETKEGEFAEFVIILPV